MNGLTLNFTADGSCTSDNPINCVAFSNNTVGNWSVIPPVRSARLTTKLSKSIKFGKVEVKARMPTGDWIWPASTSLFSSFFPFLPSPRR
jgi:beta-glucanase (GH16 family)